MAQAAADGWQTEFERAKRTASSLTDPLSREMLSRYLRDLELVSRCAEPPRTAQAITI
jgi:hypothetical protein